MLRKKTKARHNEIFRYALLLFSIFCIKKSLSQQLYSGTIVIQDKSLSVVGIPIRRNSRIVTHTSENGSFSFCAEKGDTVQIASALYYTDLKILTNELNFKVVLRPKITQLEGVHVNFSKSVFVEQIIRASLAKLKKVDSLPHPIFLKQLGIKNNLDTLLSTEGVLNYSYLNIDSSRFNDNNIAIKVSDVCIHKGLFGRYLYKGLNPKWIIFSSENPLYLAKIFFNKKEKFDIKYTEKEVLINYHYRDKKNTIAINFIIDKITKRLLEIQETWEGKETLTIINYNFLNNHIYRVNSYSYKRHIRDVLTTKDEWRFYEDYHLQKEGVEWDNHERNLQKYEHKLPPGCDNINKFKSTYNQL